MAAVHCQQAQSIQRWSSPRVRCAAWFVVVAWIWTLGQPSLAAAESSNIAILLSADAPAYQEAIEGFRQTTSHRIVAQLDMKGDPSRGKRLLGQVVKHDRPDVILAVGVWALQAASAYGPDIPIVYVMVLNPPSIAVANHANVTGASMNVSPGHVFELVTKLSPSIKRVGVVYTEATTGFLIREAQVAAQRFSLELIAISVDSPREAVAAADQLQDAAVEAIWIAPDPMVIDPQVFKHLLLTSYRTNIPVIGMSESQAEMGSLVSIQFASNEDIGRQAGELVNQLLSGIPATQIPFTTSRMTKLILNLRAARKIGFAIPESVLNLAEQVID